VNCDCLSSRATGGSRCVFHLHMLGTQEASVCLVLLRRTHKASVSPILLRRTHKALVHPVLLSCPPLPPPSARTPLAACPYRLGLLLHLHSLLPPSLLLRPSSVCRGATSRLPSSAYRAAPHGVFAWGRRSGAAGLGRLGMGRRHMVTRKAVAWRATVKSDNA
jgi:hypothetical protein